MENMNKDPKQLSPEEQLDLLLEQFLNDPNDEVPTFADTEEPAVSETVPEPEEASFEEAEKPAAPATPEVQLDHLLSSLQEMPDEPTPEDVPEDSREIPELLSFWDICPQDSTPTEETAADVPETEDEQAEETEPLPVILPLPDMASNEEASADDESIDNTEDTLVEEPEEELSEEAEQPPLILPMPELIPDAPINEDLAEESDTAEDIPAEEPVLEDTPADEETIPEFPAEEGYPEEDADPADEQEYDDAALTLAVDRAIEQILEEAIQEQEAEAAPSCEETAEQEDTVPEQEEAVPEQAEPVQQEEQPVPAIIPEEEKSMSDEEVTPKPEEAEDKPAEDAAPEKPVPPKKRRPKNTKAYGLFGIPHLVATAVWLGIILFIGVGLGKFVWNCVADVLALGKPNSEVIITVTEDDDLDSLAQKLKATGLINYPSLFKIYGNISEAMDTIRTGTFKLNTQFDYHALVDAMSSNQRRETINVTIPEGYTCAQIFRLLENKGVTTIEKLEAAASSADLGNYWFLEDVERGTANCLEGFMFPDTYTFYLDHDPVGVIQKFLNNFNKRFNDKMKLKLDTLNMTLGEMMRKNGLSEEYIAAHQLTVRDVVIVASMIEKETSSNPESYNISSVIYNRLTNPDKFPCLQIDATIVYYTGRSKITLEDLTTDHPYNSYTRPGLIAGPISNPGAYSLDAALDPVESEFYFYALDPSTGAHHFSKTLKEHEDFLDSIRKDDSEEELEEEPQE